MNTKDPKQNELYAAKKKVLNLKAATTAIITALIILAAGIGVVALYCAEQCSAVTNLIDSDVEAARTTYSNINPISKAIYGSKIKKAFKARLEKDISNGYTSRAAQELVFLCENFSDISPVDYIQRLADIALISAGTNEEKAAAEAACAIKTVSPKTEVNIITLKVCSYYPRLYQNGKTDELNYCHLLFKKNSLAEDLMPLIKCIATEAVDDVKKDASFSDELRKKLEAHSAFCTDFGLYEASDAAVLKNYLAYYINGCKSFAGYTVLSEFLGDKKADYNAAKADMAYAFNIAGNKDFSHSYAISAYTKFKGIYDYCLEYSAVGGSSDGLTQALNLSSQLMANALTLGSWSDQSQLKTCRETQEKLEKEFDGLYASCNAGLAGLEAYGKTPLNSEIAVLTDY